MAPRSPARRPCSGRSLSRTTVSRSLYFMQFLPGWALVKSSVKRA